MRETLKVSSTMYQNLSLEQIINERIPLQSSVFFSASIGKTDSTAKDDAWQKNEFTTLTVTAAKKCTFPFLRDQNT